MAEEFRKFLESEGLLQNTMDALQEKGVVRKNNLLHVTDDMVDTLQLDPATAAIQKATLRQVIHDMKTTPAKGTIVLSGLNLKANTVEKGGKFGALSADGSDAKDIGVRLSDMKHEVGDVRGNAVAVNLTPDTEPTK